MLAHLQKTRDEPQAARPEPGKNALDRESVLFAIASKHTLDDRSKLGDVRAPVADLAQFAPFELVVAAWSS